MSFSKGMETKRENIMNRQCLAAALLVFVGATIIGASLVEGAPLKLNAKSNSVKLVFVTSTEHAGNLGGLSGADAICQERADNATPSPLPGTYKAWLATNDIVSGPTSRFSADRLSPYIRTDGMLVAKDWSDLVDGVLVAPIEITENGDISNESSVWTAVQTSGDGGEIFDCNGWTSSSSSHSGQQGTSRVAGPRWTEHSIDTCELTRALYCFQQ
jgi:hypothetical protein